MNEKAAPEIVAIDLAKDTFLACVQGTLQSYRNEPAGWRMLVGTLRKLPWVWVFFEASGGYEQGLSNCLHQAGIRLTLLNPSRVRAFARSEGLKAKNDPIDTRLIERFARSKPLAPTPPAPHPELTALMDRRGHLTAELAREQTRLQKALCKSVRESLQRVINLLQKERVRLERKIAAAIAAKPSYARAATLMQEVKGVGPVTAWTLLAHLPEITQLSRNRLVALAGLAPFDRDSGRFHGPRHILGGRHKVREVLYMAATCAAIHNPIIKAYVAGLRARNKPYKCACTAAMRKLLLHLQSILKKHQICLF